MTKQKGIHPIENLEKLDKCLSHTAFPAKKSDIFSEALREGVDMNVITLIQGLPKKWYLSRADIYREMGMFNSSREEVYG